MSRLGPGITTNRHQSGYRIYWKLRKLNKYLQSKQHLHLIFLEVKACLPKAISVCCNKLKTRKNSLSPLFYLFLVTCNLILLLNPTFTGRGGKNLCANVISPEPTADHPVNSYISVWNQGKRNQSALGGLIKCKTPFFQVAKLGKFERFNFSTTKKARGSFSYNIPIYI